MVVGHYQYSVLIILMINYASNNFESRNFTELPTNQCFG